MADTIKKETFTVKLTYEMSVNIDTGEISETRLIDRSINNSDLKAVKSSTKKKIVEDKEPKLILEDNKYRLNNAAIELMKLSSDSKLSIKYVQGNSGDVPVICIDDHGNKITKSNTVACRGNKNAELAKYGEEFILVSHPSKPGLFILTSESIKPEQLTGDDNVNIEDEDSLFDLSLKDLAEDEDTNITEIDSSFFKL